MAERPGAHVADVHPHPFGEGDGVLPVHLPYAGEPGSHELPATLPAFAGVSLVAGEGARTDERHVAFQDVPKLRKLVDGSAPQEPADRSDPIIGGHTPLRLRLNVIRRPHRTELQKFESLTVASHSYLPKNDAWTALDPYRKRGCSQQG